MAFQPDCLAEAPRSAYSKVRKALQDDQSRPGTVLYAVSKRAGTSGCVILMIMRLGWPGDLLLEQV